MAEDSPVKRSGCGLFNTLFGRRRRTASAGSLPSLVNNNLVKTGSNPSLRRRRGSFNELPMLGNVSEDRSKPISKSSKNVPKNPPLHNQNPARKISDDPKGFRQLGATSDKTAPNGQQAYVHQGRKVPKDAVGISGELESMIKDHQRNKGSNTLVRASSGNVMLFGNLGNLRKGEGGAVNAKPAREESSCTLNGKYPNSVMGNIVRKQNEEKKALTNADPSFCRALSTRMDPETLKIMGNEDYKNGKFAEALALYDAAIAIDPNKASYRSNRSAALTALGRLLDAVFECREAIRIEPHYHRAHHRLATLYYRLGDADKALYHYRHAGPEADQEDLAKVKNLQAHLRKCVDAKRLRDWNTLIKQTNIVISSGADSAPQIYSLQSEALLKLQRHQDADEALRKISSFDDDSCTKVFGPIGTATLLVARAQVDVAMGRFDEALGAVQRAAKLDMNNKEANVVMRKVQTLAAARYKGNELFRAARVSEASVAYGEGLDHDPHNSLLLCNRAACRSKLGQFEKAIEDCTAALNLRPSYSKARLRRADCYKKMERWEASTRDYEILLKETPEDEEVKKAFSEAQAQLKKQRGT